jgi:hypothetical protein
MNKSLSELTTDFEKEKPVKFRWFDFDKASKANMTVVNDWIKVYDLQKEDSLIGSFTNVVVTIYVWSTPGYDQKQNRKYDGMFSYAEVWCEELNEVRCEQFFGETSETDALRWANDKSNEIIYKTNK